MTLADDAVSGALTLVFGNRNYSSWSLRPWLYMRHHGLPFTEHRIPLDTEQFRREIGRWSPTRRVPVLHAGGLVIWDSLAILEYLAERFPETRGWPSDPAARAVARAAAAEMHSGFGALRGELPMDCRRREPRGPESMSVATRADIARVLGLWEDCRTRFGAGGPFLFGEFGIADCMYAPVASRLVTYGVALDPVSQAWVDAVLALPAMREWLAAAEAESEVLDEH